MEGWYFYCLNKTKFTVFCYQIKIENFKANSSYFFQNFLRRHHQLSIRTPERVNKGRAGANEKDIRAWFKLLSDNLKSINQENILSDPSRVFNTDESNIQLNPKTGLVVGLKGWRNIYEIGPGPEKSTLTFIGTFSADGKIVSPTMIYPYMRIPADILKELPEDMEAARTESGWMTSQAFFEYVVNNFNNWLINHKIQKPVILFLDGHKTHLVMQLSVKCNELGIILYLLPPNTTHILQPADVGPFKPLKQYYRQAVHERQVQDPNKFIRRHDVGPIMSNVLKKVSIESIVRGFRKCGLCPFNPDAVDYTKCLDVEYIDEDTNIDATSKPQFTSNEYNTAFKIINNILGPEKAAFCRAQEGLTTHELYNLYQKVLENCSSDITSLREDTSSATLINAGHDNASPLTVELDDSAQVFSASDITGIPLSCIASSSFASTSGSTNTVSSTLSAHVNIQDPMLTFTDKGDSLNNILSTDKTSVMNASLNTNSSLDTSDMILDGVDADIVSFEVTQDKNIFTLKINENTATSSGLRNSPAHNSMVGSETPPYIASPSKENSESPLLKRQNAFCIKEMEDQVASDKSTSKSGSLPNPSDEAFSIPKTLFYSSQKTPCSSKKVLKPSNKNPAKNKPVTSKPNLTSKKCPEKKKKFVPPKVKSKKSNNDGKRKSDHDLVPKNYVFYDGKVQYKRRKTPTKPIPCMITSNNFRAYNIEKDVIRISKDK